jgi:cytidyltransferase-like protein
MMSKQLVIGFTVACLDLLHEGHINFLKSARLHCDVLVVGVMNDYWVRVQKGHERPIQSLQLRLANLRATGLADKIVVLDTLDMSPYLQIADIWIMGERQMNMRPVDFKNVIRIPETPGISTTILAKERENK